MINIGSREELRKWLGKQPQPVHAAIGLRVSLRSFPIIAASESNGDISRELLLKAARNLLTTAVHLINLNEEISDIARSIGTPNNFTLEPTSAIQPDIFQAILSTDWAIRCTSNISGETNGNAYFANEDTAGAIGLFDSLGASIAARSMAYSDTKSAPKEMISLKLWDKFELAPILEQQWSQFYTNSEQRNHWSFWRDWYQGFLDGKPLDWGLQREVALIPDADWDKGPEHIAAVIEHIRKKYDLEREIAALKDMLSLSTGHEKPADRLHNHPPEAIDGENALRTEITLVWDQLDQLEKEIAKPDPSSNLLNKIAQALWDISKRIAAYCGSLADIALKKAAEELGSTGTKWAIRIGATGVLAHSEGVQSVAKSLWEYIKTFPQ